MGEKSEINRWSTGQLKAAVDSLPPEKRRSIGIAAGGVSGLTGAAGLIFGIYQMHLADVKDARHLAAEQTEAALCEERVGRAWLKYSDHMREGHGL